LLTEPLSEAVVELLRSLARTDPADRMRIRQRAEHLSALEPTEGWTTFAAMARESLEDLRTELERRQTEVNTIHLRGQITMLRQVLRLPQTARDRLEELTQMDQITAEPESASPGSRPAVSAR